MTVNALQPSIKLLRQQKYTQNDLMIDPLIVLRCDQRIYRWVIYFQAQYAQYVQLSTLKTLLFLFVILQQ